LGILESIDFETRYTWLQGYVRRVNIVIETIDHTEVWGWIEDRSAPWADELNLELAVGGKKFVDGTDITDPAEDGEDAAGIITYGLAHVIEMLLRILSCCSPCAV